MKSNSYIIEWLSGSAIIIKADPKVTSIDHGKNPTITSQFSNHHEHGKILKKQMLFPLPGNCTLGLSSGTITKLKDNFKDQGKMYLHKATN